MFGEARALSDSLRRDGAAFHKCIKVSSERHKDAQKQNRRAVGVGVGGVEG